MIWNEPDDGSGSAPGGGVPLPAFTYAARSAAYSSADTASSASSGVAAHDPHPPLGATPCLKSCFRNGMHHPHPVPAPPHIDSWLGTCGPLCRTQFTNFRRDTWKQ